MQRTSTTRSRIWAFHIEKRSQPQESLPPSPARIKRGAPSASETDAYQRAEAAHPGVRAAEEVREALGA